MAQAFKPGNANSAMPGSFRQWQWGKHYDGREENAAVSVWQDACEYTDSRMGSLARHLEDANLKMGSRMIGSPNCSRDHLSSARQMIRLHHTMKW